MKVIAKGSEKTVLIEASESEVKEILNAVNGTAPTEIGIGQKIPALDYASTIRKIKSLKENSYFKTLVNYTKSFNEHVEELTRVVEEASKIEDN